MSKISCLLAFLLFVSEISIAQATPDAYCFKPCISTLKGHISIKKIVLNDPKKTFIAYILILDSPISVPEYGSYLGVDDEKSVQLEYPANGRVLFNGECVTAVGRLTGAMDDNDIGPLAMQVDSIAACK
jgi:hypothetical protein